MKLSNSRRLTTNRTPLKRMKMLKKPSIPKRSKSFPQKTWMANRSEVQRTKEARMPNNSLKEFLPRTK